MKEFEHSEHTRSLTPSSFNSLRITYHAMDTSPLDELIAQLDAAKTRDDVRACLDDFVAKPPRGANVMRHTFIKNLARPYMNGARPQFASEFPAHWARFKKMWDGLK